MRTSVHLPDDLLARAKRKAADEGRTLTALIEEGLRIVVTGTARGASRNVAKKAIMPISPHRGGPLPGVDLSRNSDWQEAEDLEYAVRLRKGFK